jgi:hypothetical protein
MTIPPRIRVNVAAPFPTLVTGANGIGVGKQNGIWTIGLNTSSLGTGITLLTSFPTDYVVIYDSIAKTYSQVSLATIATGGGATTVANLPASLGSTGKGLRAFVTNATQTMTAGIGAIVAGGGTNNVPVVWDGTNWRIG